MAVSLTTAQVIYAAQSRLLELADVVEQSTSFRRVKNSIKIGEALIRYIRVLQTDSTLTDEEQTAICQHMIHIGNLYDFPASPTITSNEIFNFSAGAQVGPQGEQGIPGQDGGGTDYNQFGLTATTSVDTFDATDADGAEWSYKVKDGTNLRAGRVTAVWLSDGSQIKYAEYSTLDIGSTSPVTFSVIYSAGEISLRATIASGTWDINGTRYFIPNNGAGVEISTTALANGKFFIGNASNVMEARSITGDISISNMGVAAITSGIITNGDISSAAAIGLSKLAALTADRALVSNSSGVITASSISTTKLGYLTDVTSNIQAQLDSKLSAATGAISTVVSADLTPSKVVVSDSSGKIVASTVSTTQLDNLLGSTSNIQTQLDSAQTELDTKLNLSGGTLTGTLNAQHILLGSGFDISLFGNGGVFLDTGDFSTTGRGIFAGGFRTDLIGAYLKIKVVNIGDWNMDSTATVSISHGLADHKKIRGVQVIIRDDVDTNYSALDRFDTVSGTMEGGVGSITSGSIGLNRKTGGTFDSTSYDATSFNRGWITITYEV